MERDLTDEEYAELLAFRSALRRFLSWSESQARDVGVTPAQHQLLLVIRGWAERAGPTIGEVATELQLRHHSAVELIDRAERGELVERRSDTHDRRVVRLFLTSTGEEKVRSLSLLHREELRRLSAAVSRLGALTG
jgi:DNA-binding MarR family transcriptional regulator